MTEQQEIAAEQFTPSKRRDCEVKLTIRLWRWQYTIYTCQRPAMWIALNMCCGSTTRACEAHYDLAQAVVKSRQKRPDAAHIKCGECGGEVTMEWGRLS
jgi:hypothetical protein